jgi:glycerol-3-phosphate cytidylyltransferase
MKRYKIGYTAGVFDLFHIGHLNILIRSKEMCDFLIVGVSTDELTESYKGKKPIIPYEERKAIVEAIKYVDKTVPQTTRDKYVALRNHEFNVMFVGDDWKGSDLFLRTEDEFREKGVAVVYLPYTRGTSSTLLTEVLRKSL